MRNARIFEQIASTEFEFRVLVKDGIVWYQRSTCKFNIIPYDNQYIMHATTHLFINESYRTHTKFKQNNFTNQ